MTRLRPSQIGQDGASTGQALVWNGTAWAPATPGGAAITQTAVKKGFGIDNGAGNPGTNITLSSTSYTAVDTGMDLTLAASAGDVLQALHIYRVANTTAAYLLFDAATWVSGAAVNYFGTGPSANGVSAWIALSGEDTARASGVFYTVQSGDIVSGNVTVRLLYRLINNGASSRVLNRDYDLHEFRLINYG